MASQSADPPAPYTEVTTTGSGNETARLNAYTDRSRTQRNVDGVAAASDLPPPAGSTTLGDIRPVYANDKKESIENVDAAEANAGVAPPPHAPNKMAGARTGDNVFRSRDPYRNGGMTGQSFFNPGGS